jgi:predicted transcriptional regulator
MTPKSLKAWRQRMRWQKKQAAQALDVSENGYADYEDEKRKRRIPRHIALACAAIAHGLPPID